MDDHVVREAFLRRWAKDPRARGDSLLIEELSLGAGSPRIDIAVLGTRLIGFEIKSDKDTLYRLPDQMKAYSQVFDKVTLLVSYKHAFEALKLIPEWWGVKLVRLGTRGGVYFDDARFARWNPNDNTRGMLGLLWRREVLELIDEFPQHAIPRTGRRSDLCDQILSAVDSRQIHERALHKIKFRLGSAAA